MGAFWSEGLGKVTEHCAGLVCREVYLRDLTQWRSLSALIKGDLYLILCPLQCVLSGRPSQRSYTFLKLSIS